LYLNCLILLRAGCPRVEGDEEDGAEMDDLEEEFQMKKPHEPVAFDVYSVSLWRV
jgi:hypothetical protein